MKTSIIKALRSVSTAQLAEIALQLAELHPSSFERLLVAEMKVEVDQRFVVPFTGQYVSLTTKNLTDIKVGAAGGNKVLGIKIIREATGLGLKEAKDLWEDMESKNVFHFERGSI